MPSLSWLNNGLCGSGWSRTTACKTTTGLQPGTFPFGHTPESCRKLEEPAEVLSSGGLPVGRLGVNQPGYEAGSLRGFSCLCVLSSNAAAAPWQVIDREIDRRAMTSTSTARSSTDHTRLEHAEARCADVNSRVAINMTKCKIRDATSLVKNNEDHECVMCGNADDRGGVSVRPDCARCPRSLDTYRMAA